MSIFFTAYSLNLTAQTSIAPIIGLDGLRLSQTEPEVIGCFNNTNIGCIEKGFVINKPFVGVRLEQQMTDRFKLYYQGVFTQKNYNYYFITCGFAYCYIGRDIKFHYFLQELGASWLVFNRIALGVGANLSTYKNIESLIEITPNDVIETTSFIGTIRQKKQIGITLGVSYVLNNINMRLALNRSFEKNDLGGFSLDIPTSISLSLGYRFHLFDKINLGRKGEGCPTF